MRDFVGKDAHEDRLGRRQEYRSHHYPKAIPPAHDASYTS
jgi:hypothetical protein